MSNEASDAPNSMSVNNVDRSGSALARRDDLVRFVETKGTQVAGKHKDKFERIAETACDLELACQGAFSLAQRSEQSDRGRWVAALARACSIFLRKMVIGDRDDASTRLLDDSVVETLGISFDRVRQIPAERHLIELRASVHGGIMQAAKLNDDTLLPEASVLLPIAPHELVFAVEWPLPGGTGWTSVPTKNVPWTVAPEELFDLECKEKLDCSRWLAQQLVMFDRRGITLKDVIRTVATFEGAHSLNVSRLLHATDQETKGPFKNPEPHLLDNITVFGMKYTHVVVIECALYLHEMLAKAGHIPRPPDERSRLRLSFGTTEPTDFFSENQDWLRFAGGLILGFDSGERRFTHRIRAVGKSFPNAILAHRIAPRI